MGASGERARDEILGRIRAALADVPGDEGAGDVSVPRGYRDADRGGERSSASSSGWRDYGATVRVADADERRPRAVTDACRARGARSPRSSRREFPAAGGRTGVELVVDEALDAARARRDRRRAATGGALGIAETGTIVLDCGAGQGRRALSLVPDVHVCVVRAEDVVDGVPAAMRALARRAARAGARSRFISGPSATSDIELPASRASTGRAGSTWWS